MKKLTLIAVLFLAVSCTKIASTPFAKNSIDLGTTPSATGIKTAQQTGNSITVDFSTTIGSKYSVQIAPFGSEVPVKVDGFIAVDTVTTKTYDLSSYAKNHYDLIFIDISGKEVKYPVIIK